MQVERGIGGLNSKWKCFMKKIVHKNVIEL
jgi:hypothetical protein